MRSLFKVPFVHRSVFFKYVTRRKDFSVHSEVQGVLSRRKIKLPRHLIFWNKASKITRNALIGRKIAIHNGKVYMFVNLKKASVGFKLGQLSITRRTVVHSGKLKNKKKLSGKKDSLKKHGKFNLTLKKFVAKKKIKKWA